MKYLIIILISILLLSSPVIGDNHKGETLYGWGEHPEIVWIPDKGTLPKYEGDVENGKPNGVGILIFPSGEKYVGEWKNGERHGQGTFTHPNGYKYIGDWNKGNFGTGTWYDIKGNILKKYVNGKVTYTVGELRNETPKTNPIISSK